MKSKTADSIVVDTLLHPEQAGSEFALREGPATTLALAPGQLIELVRKGLAICELETLRNALGLPIEKVASKVGMSKATFHRRQREGKLTTDESDKIIRMARLVGQATTVFGSEQAGRDWLTHPQHGLGGEIPIDYAETEIGAREVENLLGRIDYGVYT